MIKVTRLNGKEFVINTEIIEFIESTPDTVITTTTGKKVIVKEDVDEVINRVIEFKRRVLGDSISEV
ncbi:MAG: flagellar FlbD family protein [Caldicoprobacterales bacterium]|nr:flagellar FlbD family protein [Clostridiales bacterium]